jgi:hypothetical protein
MRQSSSVHLGTNDSSRVSTLIGAKRSHDGLELSMRAAGLHCSRTLHPSLFFAGPSAAEKQGSQPGCAVTSSS